MFQRMLTCGLLVLVPAPLLAQTREIGPDVLQTYEARKALLGDKELGPLNLGVRVTKRVAVLWGPVPSTEMAGRAVSLLLRLPGLIDVRNDLEIDPDLNQAPLFLPETLPQESRLPGTPSQLTILRKEGAGGQSPAATAAKEKKASLKTANGFPPVAVPPTPIPGMPDHREIEIVLPSLRIPIAEPEPAKSPQQAIAALKKDSRFAAIQVHVQGGIVSLSADPDQAQALYEFARHISGIPGIERVIVQEK